MRPPCSGPTTPACSCATAGRCTGVTRVRCTRVASITCFSVAKKLEQKHPYSPWGSKVKAVLQTGLDLRDRCRNGELTRHGLDSLRGRLEARLGRLIDAPPPLKDAKRFAKHLANEFPAVFLFLRDPSIDATNWRAEQAIRPAVVIRKVCGVEMATKKGTPAAT